MGHDLRETKNVQLFNLNLLKKLYTTKNSAIKSLENE